MKFTSAPIPGAFLIDIEPRADERGFFARAFCRQEFKAQGIDVDFVQTNISMCHKRGTIRGLHWQAEPHDETKLFRCTRGEIFLAIVDLRPASPAYLRWYATQLNDRSHNMLFVPSGCASGYQALVDEVEAHYYVNAYYHPEAEHGLRWNDESFGINWPIKDQVILSPKDAAWPDFRL